MKLAGLAQLALGPHLTRSRIVFGAEPEVKHLSVSEYKEIAKSMARTNAMDFVTVTIDFDNAKHQASGFQTKEEAAQQFSAVSDRPGAVAYVALFDKTRDEFKTSGSIEDARIDEGFFVAQTSETNVITKTRDVAPPISSHTSNLPIALGIGSAAAVGLLLFGLKR